MDFDLSTDQEALQDAARDLLDTRCPPERVRAVMDDGEAYDTELWGAMADQGWLGIAVPGTRGGVGLGTVEAAVLVEQAGAHAAPVPLTQQLLALASLGDHPLTEDLLGGEVIGTVGRTELARAGDGTVTGRTEPVLFGATASMLVAPAGDDLVAVDLRGVERRAEPAVDLTRELAWIDLDGAQAETIGDAEAVRAHLDRGAVLHSLELLGAARSVMDLAVAYAKEREQFDRPIGSFQAVKHRCADMLVDVEAMHSAAYHAAWTVGVDDLDADERSISASTAKVWCSDAGLRVAESALQVHGGIGFTWEADVHLFLKRAQLDRVAFGDAAHHRARLMSLLRSRMAAGHGVI